MNSFVQHAKNTPESLQTACKDSDRASYQLKSCSLNTLDAARLF